MARPSYPNAVENVLVFPITAFITNDIHAEYHRVKDLGVGFRGEPRSMGPITAVLFEDTCGNLINLTWSNLRPDPVSGRC